MRAKEIIAQARAYERMDGISVAEALLSVVIDLFTGSAAEEAVDARVVLQAWKKLTRELTVPEWLAESQKLSDGIDVLAANMVEAQRHDLAVVLRAISQPRFEGSVRSADVELDRLRQTEPPAQPANDNLLWVPRTVGHGV